MQATKDHISLETAKLLKDCGVESKYIFLENYVYDSGWNIYKDWDCIGSNGHFYPFKKMELNKLWEQYQAFTWQEILITEAFYENIGWFNHCTICILRLLQEQKYEEADMYFREHCILIKQ